MRLVIRKGVENKMDAKKLLDFSKEQSNQSRLVYICFCAVFCGLYFVRDIFDIGISFYLIYLWAALTMMVVSKEEAIAFFISIMAFSRGGFNGVFSVMMLAVVFIRFGYKRDKYNLSFLFLVLIAVYEFLHAFASKNVTFGVILTYVVLLLCLGMILQYPHENLDRKFILDSFICFSLFYAAMTFLVMFKTYGSLEMVITEGFRTSNYAETVSNTKSFVGNQNFLTSLCSLNISLCILLISKSKHKIPYIAATVFFVLSALLTISKMFIAVLAALALYLLYVAYKKGLRQGIAVTVLLGILFVVAYQLFADNLIAMVLDRFKRGDLTTGRLDIVALMFEYMNAHPYTYLIGAGITNMQYEIEHAVHSSVFEVIGGWGILGVFLALGYIVTLLKIAKQNRMVEKYRIDLLNYLPLFVFLGYSVIGMLFSSELAIARMTICIFALELKGGKIREI